MKYFGSLLECLDRFLNQRFTYKQKLFFFIAYFLWLVIGMMHHELWRDELQAWFIGAKSSSFSELWENKTYEGHPSGWFFITYYFNLIFGSFLSVQLFHILVSLLIAYVLLFLLKINDFLKIFFLFGSILGYEYTFFIRNYNISVLCIFLFLYLYNSQKVKLSTNFVILGIAAQFNVFATLLCSSLVFMVVMDYFLTKKKYLDRQLWIGILIYFGFGLFFIVSVIPPNESVAALSSPGFKGALTSFTYFFEELFIWGFYDFSQVSNIRFDLRKLDNIIKVITAIVTIVLIINSIKKKDYQVLVLTVTFFLLIFLFIFITGFSSTNARHSGVLLLFFISILALKKPNYFTDSGSKFSNLGIIGFAFIQFCFGLFFFTRLLIFPESHAEEISRFIKTEFPDAKVIGFKDYSLTPIGYFLNKDVYSIETPIFRHFVRWRLGYCDLRKNLSGSQIKEKCEIILEKDTSKNLLLVLENSIDTSGINMTPLKKFDLETTDNTHFEKYHLYRLK